MNRLKSVLAAAVLTLALAVSATGQVSPCNPGDTQTPPCLSALVTSDDPIGVLGEAQTPPEAQSIEIVSLVELALSVLLLA